MRISVRRQRAWATHIHITDTTWKHPKRYNLQRATPNARSMMFYRTIYLLLALLACPAAGLNTNLSRRSALLGACTAVVGVRPAPVAATAPPSVKSNAEKKYDDECISKCASKLQNINRGVGKVEYVSRIEAIKECKPGCKKQ